MRINCWGLTTTGAASDVVVLTPVKKPTVYTEITVFVFAISATETCKFARWLEDKGE